VQVVHDIAAAHDENPLIAQRTQAHAELMVERRGPCLIDAQLHDRNLGVRKHMAQHRPGAVVEPPGLIGEDVQRREQLLHACGQGRISGRGITHLKQLARKAAEIMNGARRRHRRHGGGRHIPVGRDREHRTRAWQSGAERAPGAGPGVCVQRVQGVAVSEE
jgi:hypothetical protein